MQVAEECLKVMNNFDGAVLIQQVKRKIENLI